MTISRFGISNLLNEEWFRFHTEFFTLAVACGLDVLDFFQIFPLYEPLYREADEQLEIIRRSFYTADTAEYERLRKQVFRSLRNIAKSQCRSLNPAEQSAAVKVFAAVEKYSKSILRGSLPAQTAAADNLLQDLTSSQGSEARLATEIQLLGLNKWVGSLHDTNENYKDALERRSEANAARPKNGRMRLLRREMDHYYIRIIEAVDSRLLTLPDAPANAPEEQLETPGEKILHFAARLNDCVARYHALLKGRQTRKKNLASEEVEEQEEALREMSEPE